MIKILTTAGGEATSDHLAVSMGRLEAGAIEAGIFLIALVWQFRTTRYVAAAYWAFAYSITIFGTGLADAMHLASGILFFVVILIPAAAWKWFRLNSIVAFWCAYMVTRPLGASFADYFSKPHSLSGANYGDGPVALITTIIVAVLVGYLAVTRPDIQRADQQQADRFAAVSDDVVGRQRACCSGFGAGSRARARSSYGLSRSCRRT